MWQLPLHDQAIHEQPTQPSCFPRHPHAAYLPTCPRRTTVIATAVHLLPWIQVGVAESSRNGADASRTPAFMARSEHWLSSDPSSPGVDLSHHVAAATNFSRTPMNFPNGDGLVLPKWGTRHEGPAAAEGEGGMVGGSACGRRPSHPERETWRLIRVNGLGEAKTSLQPSRSPSWDLTPLISHQHTLTAMCIIKNVQMSERCVVCYVFI
jgi:hypothetical protein